MNNIVLFKPQAELSAEKNLANLISLARDKVQIWANLEGFSWDSPSWPTHYTGARFINLHERGLHYSKKIQPQHLMSSPYIDFAKAYLRYNQQVSPTKTFQRIIAALRVLEATLIELDGYANVTKVSNRHLDVAAQKITSAGLKDRQGIGSALARIAKDLGNWHITTSNVKYWKHPFTGSDSNEKVADAAKDPKKKLPEDDALLALAEIFANGFTEEQDDEDIYITCVTALLLCAPMRINEVLRFRIDPLREEADSKGKSQLYINYWVPKNGRYVNKEIPEIMADHASEAVRRLIKITEESRRLAKHYESGSERFYKHKGCPDVPDDHELTREQVTQALGFKDVGSTETFMYRLTGSYSTTGWTLNSLWQLVLTEHRRKNKHFPYQIKPDTGHSGKLLKMSESLMCFRYQQVSNSNTTSPVLLAPMNRDFYAKRLEDRDMQRGNAIVNMSVFKKHGYDGYKLRSHQLRHFLNTLAQEAGVSIERITQWSTRASVAQTRTYMHQDPDRKANKIAEKMGLTTQTTGQPITEAEYRVMEFGPIITMQYGICTHDYTLTPCNKHADCLNCSELLMCKGHKRSVEAIKKERDQVAENFAAAQAEINAGRRVASRWHDAHSKKLSRLDQLLQVMTDPSIEDGSAIQIQGKDFSHESRIMSNHPETPESLKADTVALAFDYGDDVTACLQLLQEEDYV